MLDAALPVLPNVAGYGAYLATWTKKLAAICRFLDPAYVCESSDGTSGTTGSALVEAYDLGRMAHRGRKADPPSDDPRRGEPPVTEFISIEGLVRRSRVRAVRSGRERLETSLRLYRLFPLYRVLAAGRLLLVAGAPVPSALRQSPR